MKLAHFLQTDLKKTLGMLKIFAAVLTIRVTHDMRLDKGGVEAVGVNGLLYGQDRFLDIGVLDNHLLGRLIGHKLVICGQRT